jgi:hypothetical protein
MEHKAHYKESIATERLHPSDHIIVFFYSLR